MSLLSVRDLSVGFRTRGGMVHALDRVSLEVAPGEIVGLVGESGSGKTATALAVMGLLDPAARVLGGTIGYQGRDLLAMSRAARDAWRGAEAAMVFQNPRSALNPIRSIGAQIADVIARHDPGRPGAIRARVIEALRQVRIPDPEARARAYPFELSGGLCQRVGIAIELASAPRLLIADEPTTGLDVTTQAAVMRLIREIARARERERDRDRGILLITHDLALAAQQCDRIVVMHAGQVVESAPVDRIFGRPRHPYTAGLARATPALARDLDDLRPIAGSLPDLGRADLPACRFAERCPRRLPACDGGQLVPEAAGPAHSVACRNPL
jgi:oligopeptide/dipeptide ABC transporter ATP-binding protein